MQREYWEGVDETSRREAEAPTPEAMIVLPALEELIPEDMAGQKVLDIGPGDGSRAKAIGVRGAELWVMDEEEEILNAAFQRLAIEGVQAELVVGPPNDLSRFEEDSLDMVTVGSFVRGVADLQPIFDSIHRVLRPMGSVLIFVPHPVLEGGRILLDGIGTRQWILKDYFAPSGGDAAPPGMAEDETVSSESAHTVSGYLNPLSRAGFFIEEVQEPRPSPKYKEDGKADWGFYDKIPSYLVIQARKP
jgi:SAM-dependent methyltransferase